MLFEKRNHSDPFGFAIHLEGDSLLFTNAHGYSAAVRGDAGSDTFVLTPTAGNANVFTNFIWDLELGQTGAPIDRIDLSQMTNATGFDRLVITEGNLVLSGDPAPITEIRIQGDTANRAITLYNLAAGQLRAEHFLYADRPGFVGGDSADNTLTGDAGANTLDGEAGADVMTGRTGDDTYLVDDASDTVIELPDGGYDTVQSNVTVTLSDNVENLVLTGAGNLNGTGNAQANRLTGNRHRDLYACVGRTNDSEWREVA